MTTKAASIVFCTACGHNLAAEQLVELGPLAFDPRGAATWRQAPIELTSAQFLLFGALAQARGSIVSNDVLAARSGYDGDGDAHDVVHVHVGRIRRRLRSIGAPPTIIRTVRGRGCAIDVELLDELDQEARRQCR